MSQFDQSRPLEERIAELRMEINQLILASGLNNEQARQALEDIIRNITVDQELSTPSALGKGLIPEVLKKSTMRLFMPKTVGREITQGEVGSFDGSEVKKGEWAIGRFIINGELARTQITNLAESLGFKDQLMSALLRKRSDDPVLVDMEYIVPDESPEQDKPVINIPYRGDQQELSRIQIIKSGKQPTDIVIKTDDDSRPLKVIIRIK